MSPSPRHLISAVGQFGGRKHSALGRPHSYSGADRVCGLTIVLLPESSFFRRAWDWVILLAALWYALTCPIQLGFLSSDPHSEFLRGGGSFILIDVTFDALFVLDLLLGERNVRTGPLQKTSCLPLKSAGLTM